MRGKLLVAAMFLLPVAPAYGADLKIAETVNPSGDPGLTAAVWPKEDAGTIEWRRCADGGAVCEPLPDSAYVRTIDNGRAAFPGETPAGTVFEAVATKDGVETKARTRGWQGRLASATPPALQGEAAVGKAVTAVPGTWSGGWGSSPVPTINIFACRDATAGDCWLIAYGATVAPEPQWAGWYLLAQEYFTTGDAVCNAILGCFVTASLVATPFKYTPQRATTIALSAPFGPVAGPPTVVAKKAPTASVRARALRRKGQLHVARVSCESGCSVQLKVSGGKRRAVYRTLRVMGVRSLTAPVRHGKLKVRVIIDGKLVASGATIAR
jgi:hypothetical protein